MTSKVFKSGSYEEALGIIGEYVHIAAVNEPVCYRIDRKRDWAQSNAKAADSEQCEAAERKFEGSPCDENEDLDDDTDKSEEQGMSMGMWGKSLCRNPKS